MEGNGGEYQRRMEVEQGQEVIYGEGKEREGGTKPRQ